MQRRGDYLRSSNSENWKMRSMATAAIPVASTVTILKVRDFTTAVFFVVRQTMGRFTAALERLGRSVALPARAAVILPCMAMVAAAAVVLALLTSPPNMPVASIP